MVNFYFDLLIIKLFLKYQITIIINVVIKANILKNVHPNIDAFCSNVEFYIGGTIAKHKKIPVINPPS